MRGPIDIDLAVRCIQALKDRGEYSNQLIGLPQINCGKNGRFRTDEPLLYSNDFANRYGTRFVVIQKPLDPRVAGDGRLTKYRDRVPANYIRPIKVSLE